MDSLRLITDDQPKKDVFNEVIEAKHIEVKSGPKKDSSEEIIRGENTKAESKHEVEEFKDLKPVPKNDSLNQTEIEVTSLSYKEKLDKYRCEKDNENEVIEVEHVNVKPSHKAEEIEVFLKTEVLNQAIEAEHVKVKPGPKKDSSKKVVGGENNEAVLKRIY